MTLPTHITLTSTFLLLIAPLFHTQFTQFPSVYRSSIQLHTWLTVTLIVYSTTQIIFRDAAALYVNGGTALNVGNPETILPELILWSMFIVSAIFQLSLAPTTFLNYCFVTSVEEFVKMDAVKKSFILDELREEMQAGGEMTKPESLKV